MIDNPSAAALWSAYCAAHPDAEHNMPREPEVWPFGDSPALADELCALVVAGTKTATADLVWTVEFEGRTIPKSGDISIILDGRAQAVCIIQTTAVTIRPYNEVPPEFAYDEGEGDRSLAYWRDAHWRYFSRRCAEMGRQPTLTMPVVCEHFRLLYRP